MPFSCAKAVCLTFCHKIAGALIPLFGPRFPYDCVPEKTTGHGRMIIDPDIVLQAKRDANAFFKPHHALPSPRSSRSASPLPSQRSARRPEPYNYHTEYDRQLLLSPYITDTDVDSHPRSEPYGLSTYPLMPPLRTAGRPPPPPTPLHSPGWTTVNQSYYSANHLRSTFNPNEELHSLNVTSSANPWLSAIPRSPTPASTSGRRYPLHQASSSTRFPEQSATSNPQQPYYGTKRGFDKLENNNDDDYDAGESNHSRGGSTPPTGEPDGQVRIDDKVKASTPPSMSPALAVEIEMVKLNPMTPPAPDSTRLAPADNTYNPRRASEQDAAVMLMYMRKQGKSDGEQKEDGDGDGDGDGDDRRENVRPKDDGHGDGNGNGKRIAGEDDSHTNDTDTKPTYSPSPIVVEIRTPTPTPTTGPNTRAKRRRTLMK